MVGTRETQHGFCQGRIRFRLGFDLDGFKETSWGLIVSLTALLAVFTGLIVLVLLSNDVLCPRTWTTCGLTQPAVAVNVVVLTILVRGLLWWVGGMSPREVGLDPAKLPEGLVVTFGLWVLSEIVASALQLVNSRTVVIDPWWVECGARSILGVLLPRFVGCTLKEEVAFRGFLLIQLLVKLRSKMPGRRVLPMLLALVISQSIFALVHIPCQVCSGTRFVHLPLVLLELFGSGLFLSLIYLRTANLFVAVGVHTLLCLSTPLFMPTDSGSWLIYILGFVLIGMWPLLRGHRCQMPVVIGTERQAQHQANNGMLHDW